MGEVKYGIFLWYFWFGQFSVSTCMVVDNHNNLRRMRHRQQRKRKTSQCGMIKKRLNCRSYFYPKCFIWLNIISTWYEFISSFAAFIVNISVLLPINCCNCLLKSPLLMANCSPVLCYLTNLYQTSLSTTSALLTSILLLSFRVVGYY